MLQRQCWGFVLYLEIWLGLHSNPCNFYLSLKSNCGLKQQLAALRLQSLVWYGGFAGGPTWLKGPIPGSAWILLICWLISASFSPSEKNLYSRIEGRLIQDMDVGPAWRTGEKETKAGNLQDFASADVPYLVARFNILFCMENVTTIPNVVHWWFSAWLWTLVEILL